MLVGFNSPKPNCLYIEYGSRLTLDPRSSSALSMHVPPMLTEMVGDPGSLYFNKVLHWMRADLFSQEGLLINAQPPF